jgi:TP901 family phage tail tape measure protein
MAVLSKGVSFKIVTDAGEGQEKLDQLNASADKLKEPIEIKVGGEVGSAGEQIDAIDKELADLKNELGLTDEGFAKLAEAANAMAGGFGEADGVTASFREQLTGLGDAAAAVRDQEAGLAEADNRLIASQRTLASATAAEARSLKMLAAAEDELKGAAEETEVAQEGQSAKTEESAGIFASAAGKIKLAALGAGAGIIYGTIQAAKFNQEMLRVHTLAGVSTNQLAQLKSGVLALAGQVGESPDSLAESLYHVASNLASVGATGPEMLGAVKIAAEGAQVGGADLVDVTNALGAAIASGIPGVQNYASAMGALNATVGAGDMTMQNLAEAMGTGFLSNVKIYGSTLNDVGAILATFGDNNIRGAHAGTQLRMSVQSIAVQASTATPYLKELGLQVGELGQYQSLHGTVATINLLVEKLKASGIAHTEWGNIITQLFGKKAGAGIAVLIDQYGRLDSKLAVLKKGASDFGSEWAQQQQTVSQEWKNLKEGLDALAIKLGTVFLPISQKVLHAVDDFVEALDKGKAPALALAAVIGGLLAGVALKKLEDGVKSAAEGFEGLYKGGEAVAGFAKNVVTNMLGIGDASKAAAAGADELAVAQTEGAVATDAAATAERGFTLALLTNPITLIITGLVLLGVAIYELVTHCKVFRDFWIDVWKDIKTAFDYAFNWVKSHWLLVLGILTGPIGIAVVMIIKYWKQIQSGFEDAFKAIGSFFDTVYHGILAGAEAMATGLYDWFVKIPIDIIKALASLDEDMFKIGVNIILGIIHGIESMVSDLLGTVGGIAKDIGSGFSKVLHILSPSQVFFGFGQNIVLGLINGINAMRSTARSTVANLANDVANSFSPNMSGVTAAGAYGRTGSGNVFNVTIPVQGLVGDAGSTGRQIAEALNEYLRQTGQKQLVGA